MLLGHLLCGILVGVLVACGSLVMDASLWEVVGSFIFGTNLGLGASVLRPDMRVRSADRLQPLKV
jgi:hypothetical protein